MWVTVTVATRQLHASKEIFNALIELLILGDLCQEERLSDALSNRKAWIERAGRVLEDDSGAATNLS
jgi:hypothetical protein